MLRHLSEFKDIPEEIRICIEQQCAKMIINIMRDREEFIEEDIDESEFEYRIYDNVYGRKLTATIHAMCVSINPNNVYTLERRCNRYFWKYFYSFINVEWRYHDDEEGNEIAYVVDYMLNDNIYTNEDV